MKRMISFLIPIMLFALLFWPVQGAISDPKDSGLHEVTTERRQIGDNPEALIWTWGRFHRGIPLSIGVTFTDPALGENVEHPEQDNDMFTAAFDDFPRAVPHKTASHLESARVYDLPFPDEVQKKTPFNHMGWFANLEGHNPPFVFDVAHIDIHFFMITVEERAAIKGGLDPQSPDDFDPKLLNYPAPGFLPADFCLPLFTAVPPFCKLLTELTDTDIPGSNDAEQGLHWVDSFAPELRGKPFEQVFIYGSYDGEVNFWEPMITKAFLVKLRDLQVTFTLSFPIKQPEQFRETGYYPTQYSISYNAEAGELSVSLDNFVLRKAARSSKKK